MRSIAVLLVALLLPAVGALPVLDDDAGSGQDAPNAAGSSSVTISPGVVYNGTFSPPADTADFYAFTASNGDTLQGILWPATGCIAFVAPDLTQKIQRCYVGGTTPVDFTADASGTWYLGVTQFMRSATPYRFSLGVGADAPDPEPAGLPTALPPQRYIQPGEQVSVPGGSCTLNFAYNGTGSKSGDVFIGTAAHCFSALGQSASISGVANFGTVVYMGDYSGINTGSFSNGIPGTQRDFALIKVDPAYHHLVKGEVKGHPGLPVSDNVMPRNQVTFGSRFDFSGYGTGFTFTSTTREDRFGVYTFGSGGDWNAIAPISPGDSGGPVLHAATGRAVGVATHTTIVGFPTAAHAGGPWLEVAMQEASNAGWPTTLRPAY